MIRDYRSAFGNELAIGHRFEELVAEALLDSGCSSVERVQPIALEDQTPEFAAAGGRGELADDADLVVDGRFLIEVKSRDLSFTCPDDYPFSTAFVGRVARWDRRTTYVHAVALVSMQTEAIVVVPLSSRRHWLVEQNPDRVTRRTETSYACPREYLRPWAALVDWLEEQRHNG